MTSDLLERLEAVNPAVGDDPAPAWEDTRRRLPTPRPRLFRPRTLALGGAVAAAAVTASFVLSSGDPAREGRPLGVLEAVAATAATDARFSGYTAETRVHISAEGAGTDDSIWTVVRPLSSTEYEARIETLRPAVSKLPPGAGFTDLEGVQRSERREGDQIRDITRWRQPYGTMFQLTPTWFPPGSKEPAVAVPADPAEVAAAVAAFAADRVPAGMHPQLVSLLQDAGRSPIARTLLYAGNVLTSARVSPDVRSAVYRALSQVQGVKIDPTARDRLGRPAAALIAEDTDGKSRTRSELLIDRQTSRILAERHVFTPEPGANENRGKHDPPYGAGWEETTYRYTG